MERNAKPAWLRPALALVAGAVALVAAWQFIAPVLLLVLGGAALAFLLEPLSRRMEKIMHRTLASVLSLLIALIGVALFIYLLVPPLIQQATDLAAALPASLEALRGLFTRFSEWTMSHGLGSIEFPKMDLSNLSGELMSFALGTVGFAGSIANAISQGTMMAVLSIFFMIDRENLLLRLELLIPLKHRMVAVRMGNAAKRELRLYLRGQLTISLAVGSLCAFGLWLVGVRSALVLGALIGILNLIPYLGPVLGSVPAIAAALTSGVQTAIFAGIVLVVVQQLDGMLISPRIMGNLTGLSPAAVLIAVFAGGCVNGMLGMLLALPVLMVFRTCVRVFVQRAENI